MATSIKKTTSGQYSTTVGNKTVSFNPATGKVTQTTTTTNPNGTKKTTVSSTSVYSSSKNTGSSSSKSSSSSSNKSSSSSASKTSSASTASQATANKTSSSAEPSITWTPSTNSATASTTASKATSTKPASTAQNTTPDITFASPTAMGTTDTHMAAANTTANNKAAAAAASPAPTTSGAATATSGTTSANTQGTAVTYTPKGDYNDAVLRANNDAEYIDQQKAIYTTMKELRNAAKAIGNTEMAAYYQSKMDEAHANAELKRAEQGYSGGADGSQYIATPQNTPASVWSLLPGAGNQTEEPVFLSEYDKQMLSDADQEIMLQLKRDYLATSDPEKRKAINAQAEAIRAKYGYSLGSSGNRLSLLEQEEDMIPQTGLPSYEPQIDAINQIYNTLSDVYLSQLLAAYNNSRANAENQIDKIPELYQIQKNAVAADNEREKMAFREQAAATGMNAGNRSQAALAYSNQLQNSLGQLNTAEANALTTANHELTQLYNNYQQQIAQAVAENNYQRAAALLQEYQTAQTSRVNTALQQANLNYQVADFNRQTRQNQLAAKNQEIQNQITAQNQEMEKWQNEFNLANALAGIGSFSMLGNMGGLTEDQIKQLQNNYSMIQAGWPDYAYLRGYGYGT